MHCGASYLRLPHVAPFPHQCNFAEVGRRASRDVPDGKWHNLPRERADFTDSAISTLSQDWMPRAERSQSTENAVPGFENGLPLPRTLYQVLLLATKAL